MLLKEIKTERGEVPLELKEEFNKAKEEFLINLGSIDTHGPQFIKILYGELDKYLKLYLENNEITCHKGFGKHLFDIPEDHHQLISEPIRTKYFGKPCPFLKNEVCQIYPVRPSICRTTKVKGDFCGKHVQLGLSRDAKPIRLFYDQVVMELIKEENKKIKNEIKVLPVMVWPLTKTFKKEFFS